MICSKCELIMKYLDDYCYEDKDGDCCCDKAKEEIENDIEEYLECMRYEEEVLAEEMEKQSQRV